ncbi:MAG: hypothetical protein FWF51_04905 [Chitinivibrionia bacterium]|nr:hypothetical protein [Chitinivibrionia bacterium]
MLPVVVDTLENCDLLFDILKNEPIVAMDTEFVWTRSYFPFVGIIQIGISAEKSYLLDTAVLPQCPQSFRDFLENENIMKVFHDAYQDVQIVNYYANTVTKNVLDTQLAAAFTGFGRAPSLGELIEKVCNKTLSKSETLTNWMKRPLTQAQYEYALDDVRYLTDCAKELIRLAKENGVWEWIMDDCNDTLVVSDPFDFLNAVERSYQKEFTKVAFQNRWKLYRLCYAVEDLARKKNLPRSFLFKPGQLAEIINCNPEDFKNLKKTSLSPKNQERYARFIIESINDANVAIDENLVNRVGFMRDKNATLTGECAKEIGDEFEKAANEKGIAISRIYNRRQITNLVRGTLENKEVAQLYGWRNVFLGEIWNNFWENKRERNIL